MPPAVVVAEALVPILAPVVLAFDGVTVVDREPGLDAPLAEAEARLRASGTALDEPMAATRALYRRVGLDPTKTRPSSEALLRRVRKGEPLPRVNSLVDVCNWCSVESQIPFGLYDLDRVSGGVVTLRLGTEGEGYEGIRKDRVNVAGRPTAVDALGPFGNPTSDSARTMVTAATTRALFVLFAARAIGDAARRAAAALTAARVQQFAGGRQTLCVFP
jgi:DNA/RNA-binding domain of Phe-tRNA-synthetase-like protein